MKYRLLNADELSVLEEDLKAFLIINGIDGEIWAQINKEKPDKAIQLVALFSDTVLQKVYEKINYLEYRSANSCLVFKLNKLDIQLISLQLTGHHSFSLSDAENINKTLNQARENLEIYKSQKKYSKNRELEIHEMISQGCIPSNSEFWTSLEKAFLH